MSELQQDQLFDQLRSQGVDDKIIEFIRVTSLPKGHPEKLPVARAAKTIVYMSPGGAINKAYTAITDGTTGYNGFLCTQFHAEKAKELETLAEEQKAEAEKNKGTRPRLTPEKKAPRIAEKRIMSVFREGNNLNPRGRLPLELKEKFEQFKSDNLQNEINKVLAELKEEDSVKETTEETATV